MKSQMNSAEDGSPRTAWVPGDAEARRHHRESILDLVLRNPVAGEVIDISVSGLGLESSDSLVPLSRQRFTLGIGEARATVLVEVRWCKLARTMTNDDDDSEPFYRAGVSLLEPIVLS